MISTSSSSSTKVHQYRCQMKKTKVFSGFTNQLKEVLGRLRGSRWCQTRTKPSAVSTTTTAATPPPRMWPCLLRPPLTLDSPRAQAPCAPSPLAVSQPPPQSAAQTLPLPFPGKEGTEAKFLGGLRPDPRPPHPFYPRSCPDHCTHRKDVDIAS